MDLDWASIALAAWLGGVAVVLLRLTISLFSVGRITRRASSVTSPEWMSTLGDAATALALSTPVRLKSSNDTTTPAACGILKPTVLLPPDATGWPADRRRVVLLHELAHVARRDCLVQCLAQVARAVHWFNPLAHLAISRLRAEQERACDDLVLAAGTDGPLYADHLLEIALASSSPRPHAWAVLAMAHRSNLEGRLMAILNDDRKRRPPARWTRVVVAGTGGAVIALLGALQLTAAAGRNDIQPNTLLGVRIQPLAATQRTDTVVRPHNEARMETAERAAQASSTSPAAPRTIGQIVDTLPDIDLDFDFNFGAWPPLDMFTTWLPPPDPNPDPNPQPSPGPGARPGSTTTTRPSVQLKGAPGSQPSEVSEDTRRRVADALQTALGDDDESVRAQALWALGAIRDECSVPGLLKGARDASPRVRMAALSALAQFSTAEATEAIVGALNDANADVRALAVRYVSRLVRTGALNDTKYVDVFVTFLRDGTPDVRVQAAIALGSLGRPEAVSALLPLLKDTNINVRRQAVVALGEIADPRAVDGLTATLKDSESDVREQAARALGRTARGQRGMPPIPPFPPAPPLPGASVLPPQPPAVSLDVDSMNELVARAREETRRSMEELERHTRELYRQQEELRRQLC